MSQNTSTQPPSSPNKVPKHFEGQTPAISPSGHFSGSSSAVSATSSISSGSKVGSSSNSYNAPNNTRFDRHQTEKPRPERSEHSHSGFSSSTSSSSPHRQYQHSTSPYQSSFSSKHHKSPYRSEESRNRPSPASYGSSSLNNASNSTQPRINDRRGDYAASTQMTSGHSSNSSHRAHSEVRTSPAPQNGPSTQSNNRPIPTEPSMSTTTPEAPNSFSTSVPSGSSVTPAASNSSHPPDSSNQVERAPSVMIEGNNGNATSMVPAQPTTRLISLSDFLKEKKTQSQSASRGPVSSNGTGPPQTSSSSIPATLTASASQPSSNISVTQLDRMSDNSRPPTRGDTVPQAIQISTESIVPPRDPPIDSNTPDTVMAIASALSTQTPTPIAAGATPEASSSPAPVEPVDGVSPHAALFYPPQEANEAEQPAQNPTAMDISEPPPVADTAETSVASTSESRSEYAQSSNVVEAAAKRTASVPEKESENEWPSYIAKTVDYLSKDDKDRPNYPFKPMTTDRAQEFADALSKPQDGGTTSSSHEDAPQTASLLAGAAARWRKFCKWHGVEERKNGRVQNSTNSATTPVRPAAAAPVAMDISDVPSSAMMSAVAASSARAPGTAAPRRLSALSPAPTQPPKSLTSKVNLDFAKLYVTQKVQSLAADEQAGSSPAALARMSSVIQNRFETYLATMTPNFAAPVSRGGDNDENRPGVRRPVFTSRIAVAGITRDTFHALKRVLKAHYPLTDVTMTDLMEATIFLVDTNRAFDWDQYIAILHNIMVVRSEWADLIVTRHVLLPIDSFLIPESKSPHFSAAYLYERDLFIWNPPITPNHRRSSNKASETRTRALISFACRFLGIEYRYWDAALDSFEEDPKQYVLVVPEWFAISEEALQQPATNFSDIWSYNHLLHYMSTCSAPKPPQRNL